MRLYHGSNILGLDVLKPRVADHERPYVYMTTIDTVAALYLCNAVEKPYYWFPYGFDKLIMCRFIMNYILMPLERYQKA